MTAISSNRTACQRLGMLAIGFSFIALLLFPAHQLCAQLEPVTRPTTQMTGGPTLLGPEFRSETAGIAFLPPVGGKEIRRPGTEVIVVFKDPADSWSLKATRTIYKNPLPLTAAKNAEGHEIRGVMELTIDQVKEIAPNSEVLKQDTMTLGDTNRDVGILIMRSNAGDHRNLVQAAIIRDSEGLVDKAVSRFYYVLTYQTAVPSAVPDKNEDPNMPDVPTQTALTTFRHIVDSIQVLDRVDIRKQQDARIIQTRLFYLNLKPDLIKNAIIPESYYRIVRDDKDVGYTRIFELIATHGKETGIQVGVQTRSYPREGVKLDVSSKFFSSYDHHHEMWNSAGIWTQDNDKKDATEFGTADLRQRRVARSATDPLAPITITPTTEPADRQNALNTIDEFILSVTNTVQGNAGEPTTIQLPEGYYLPQALAQILPRLLPRQPRGYLFGFYVSDRKNLMLRYIDVESDRDVVIDGKTVHAIPIRDRIGLEGAVTTQYISLEGKFLGSQSENIADNGEVSNIWILPSDADTLKRIWKDAMLAQPQPAESANTDILKH